MGGGGEFRPAVRAQSLKSGIGNNLEGSRMNGRLQSGTRLGHRGRSVGVLEIVTCENSIPVTRWFLKLIPRWTLHAVGMGRHWLAGAHWTNTVERAGYCGTSPNLTAHPPNLDVLAGRFSAPNHDRGGRRTARQLRGFSDPRGMPPLWRRRRARGRGFRRLSFRTVSWPGYPAG